MHSAQYLLFMFRTNEYLITFALLAFMIRCRSCSIKTYIFQVFFLEDSSDESQEISLKYTL